MIKFDVFHRFSGDVQFTAEIDCPADAPKSIKLGLAVKWAIKTSADLRSADLTSFKSDLWMTLTQAHAEVPALVAALRDGRVDGSTYEGPCACLVGTLSNAHVGNGGFLADRSVSHPAEQWFLMIKKGDRPGDIPQRVRLTKAGAAHLKIRSFA